MKKILPYILITIVFIFFFIAPFFAYYFWNKLPLEYIGPSFNAYVRNPVIFFSSATTIEEHVPDIDNVEESEIPKAESAFSSETNEDDDFIYTPLEGFTYQDTKPLSLQEFVEIRDRNLYGDSETDKDFTIIDVLNAEIGDDLIGGKVSFSGNSALQDVLVTTKTVCNEGNSYLYDGETWSLSEVNINVFENLSQGDQLVTSCLDEECQYSGRYCGVLKW